MKIAIVGSRDFPKLDLVDKYIYHNIVNKLDLWKIDTDYLDTKMGLKPLCEIVSGKGGSVDLRAAEVARQYDIPLTEFPARWRIDGIYNHGAGIERNKLIAEYADIVVAFSDPGTNYKNSGTLSTCHFAANLGKSVRIITGIE